MKLIASKNFTMAGKYYFANDEVKINDFEKIVKLNEQGFIKPLSLKELINIQEELQIKDNKKEGE